jgi:hypothetical protein
VPGRLPSDTSVCLCPVKLSDVCLALGPMWTLWTEVEVCVLTSPCPRESRSPGYYCAQLSRRAGAVPPTGTGKERL